MGQEPRRLVGRAEHAGELVRAHALLARAHQMERHDPLVERKMAALHHSADRDREGPPASIALEQAGPMALALQALHVVNLAAVRAERAVRPADTFQVSPGGIVIVEHAVGEVGNVRIAYLPYGYVKGTIGIISLTHPNG